MRAHTPFFLFALLILSFTPSLGLAAKTVFVSIPPQAYFVEKIGGDLADVHVLVPPGATPHTYEPSPREMVKLAQAEAYFAIGVEFEKAWLPRLTSTNKGMVVINTHNDVRKIPMAAHEGHEEVHHGHSDEALEPDHDDHGHDDHEGEGILDPHIWLSATNGRLIAENACAGFIKIDPTNTQFYKNNLINLLKEIDQLDKDIRHGFSTIPKGKHLFMVFHPSWGYFAHDYGLTQIPIESEGNEPSPRSLSKIVQRGRKLGITTIFVQPQFSDRSAKVIAGELDANVVPLDPLARDWEQNMRRAALAIQETAID